MSLREDADYIIKSALKAVQPDKAVQDALEQIEFNSGKLVLIAIGKASWQMAKAAYKKIHDRITCGVVITKYYHGKGPIGKLDIFEAGHPVSDDNTYKATAKAIGAVSDLNENDNVLFLVSGGGSALFENPLVDPSEYQDITKQLLSSGADIVEINTIRKRLSAVKGGKFAQICAPAHVFSIILSDIIGDPLDMIASGPAYPDSSTCDDAVSIVSKYSLKLSHKAELLLRTETPKKLDNISTYITGSVRQLCKSASETAIKLGYEPHIITDSLNCEAKEAGKLLASIAIDHQNSKKSLAFIAGGETVVHITGTGKGGRNQEIALAAADGISGLEDTCVFSFGSDGTDGPTDAAGGYSDQNTSSVLKEKNISIQSVLEDNDSYNALKLCNGLIITGPTGTNVNDLSVLLIKRSYSSSISK